MLFWILFLKWASIKDVSKAIEEDKADKTKLVIITLLDNDSSIVTSKNSIDLKVDLVINGSGKASITSSTKSAIKTKGRLYLKDASLDLAAEGEEDGHGISASSITIKHSSINVLDCGKDGLHAEIDDVGLTRYVNSSGYIYLEDSSFSYCGEGDGIQADSFIKAVNSSIFVTNEAHFVLFGSEEASSYNITDKDEFKFRKSGDDYYKVDSEQRGRSGTYAMVNSTKGIKVGEIDQEDSEVTF